LGLHSNVKRSNSSTSYISQEPIYHQTILYRNNTMISNTLFFFNIIGFFLSQSLAFTPTSYSSGRFSHVTSSSSSCRDTLIPLRVSAHKTATEVTGEELEMMLEEWDLPLVIDAYATWCGPCMQMAPEFEEAAKELEGKVRFVKIDTDKEVDISARLNIMAMPTMLFLEGNDSVEGVPNDGRPVLKQRFEGALQKDSIVALCEHLFFDKPLPEQLY